ncbi:MAG: efflux RND transporter periplasmic adaptor subunit [Verrucomicrobia bacterium]|nr:efflux RND transporter periplasmic adaptor subunit [Verrucomicrobiota bacterium]
MSKKPSLNSSLDGSPSGSRVIKMRSSGIGRAVLAMALVVPGALGYWHFSKRQPNAPVSNPKPQATEARVKALHRQDYKILIKSQGPVRAHSEVSLTAQVAGRITRLSEEFEEGAFFEEGQVLAELDIVDFEVALVAAEAQVAQAELNFAEESTRVTQARLNWEDLGYEEEASDLVLRKPQLKHAESQLKLAETQLESARRDLQRSRIRAPFTGRVLSRSVGIGQTIGATTPLGIIFATDYSEVRLPVSTRFLTNLTLPEDSSDPGIAIKLKDGLNESSGIEWDAQIIRTEGALDKDTLELFAIARVDDPFGVTSGKVPLRVGQPVTAEIPGKVLEQVFIVPREAVTGLNRIRLVDPESLVLRSSTMDPIWSDETSVIINDPAIEDGTLLVLSPMMHAPDGGKIEIIDDTDPIPSKATGAATAE